MSAFNVQKKIKKGLAKAFKAIGDSSSPIVYLEKVVITGGTSPIDPPIHTTTQVELKNAVFISVTDFQITGGLVQAGDVNLTCDGDHEILIGAIIIRDSIRYLVKDSNPSEPFGIRLSNQCVLRKQ